MLLAKYNKHEFLQTGFTLIEIIVTMAILAIVTAAFLPLLSNSMSNIIRPGQSGEALYQAQSDIENFTNSVNNDKVTIGTTTVNGTLLKVDKTVSGNTVSLYYFYVP